MRLPRHAEEARWPALDKAHIPVTASELGPPLVLTVDSFPLIRRQKCVRRFSERSEPDIPKDKPLIRNKRSYIRHEPRFWHATTGKLTRSLCAPNVFISYSKVCMYL